MGSRLVVELRQDQVAAATEIYDSHMPGWASTDGGLELLAGSVPGFGPHEALLKAAPATGSTTPD